MLRFALAILLCLCSAASAQLAGGLQFPGPGTAHTTGGGGSVAIDATHIPVTAAITNVSPLTWLHTPVGTPTAVAVLYYAFDGAGSGTASATYGGVAMTETVRVFDGSFAGGYSYIFGLANPPAGAQTVVITPSGSANAVGTSITVTGSNTGTAFSHTAGALVQQTTDSSVTVTSATGELVVDICTFEGGSDTMSVTGPQTTFVLNTSVSGVAVIRMSAGTSPGAGSVSPTYHYGVSQPWLAAAASFKQ